ncbi:hypothetical protein HMPREF3223_00380 [Cutibacterium avidum]|nr:hypothetical protein HMPREF3223_00380 [Cutibacterium avidum]
MKEILGGSVAGCARMAGGGQPEKALERHFMRSSTTGGVDLGR